MPPPQFLSPHRRARANRSPFVLAALAAASAPIAWNPSSATAAPEPASGPEELPAVTITAQKSPEPMQAAPLSVTAIDQLTIENAGIRSIRDASIYAPNITLTEFSARKLSNPRFRGIGASPSNPGVTTYIDGVPQLNANSSSLELVDIEQIEFVRGPQGALYGRNTVGGLINITSRRPSKTWQAAVDAGYGNYNYRDARISLGGPLDNDKIGLSLAGGFSARDGYTENTLTGNDLDSREALFGKAQLQLEASDTFNVRLIVSGEDSDDGDYAFGDLGALRSNPSRVSRDFEGFTERQLWAPTLIAEYTGESIQATSITGGVWWETADLTDIDYTPMPLMTRSNREEQFQFTQEIRVGSALDKPIELAEQFRLSWQSGVFLFSQDYEQDAFNTLSPFVTGAPISVTDHALADLEDFGVGVYAQAKVQAWEKLELTARLRFDYEDKEASLSSFTTPELVPGSSTQRQLEDDFSEFTPQTSLSYAIAEEHRVYGAIARGFKAGGFNPISPAASEAYFEEETWNYELGYKSTWLEGKFRANFALFYIDWDDLQLNVPVATAPGRYYIDNVGAARSQGVEAELAYRPYKFWDLFGSVGYTDAEFDDGSSENGVSIDGRRIPYAPRFTANAGTQLSWSPCEDAELYFRAEMNISGDYEYDSSNAAGQDTYTIAAFRAGVRGKNWFVEGWIHNAFDEEYLPIALPYSPAFAPSGYIAESGTPAIFGIRAGLNF